MFQNYTAAHFKYFYVDNRKNLRPFDVQLCNVNTKSGSAKHLLKLMPNLLDENAPFDVFRQCYSDLYPREKLVYLTPYSPNVLENYNPDDVYVIGAVIDHGYNGPITLTKAKELGIRTAWLPIRLHMSWNHHGSKLPLNQAGNILLDYKNTRDWRKSFQHVAPRLQTAPRHERHELHKMLHEAEETHGEMPRFNWTKIRDETRVMADAANKGIRHPFKQLLDRDASDSPKDNEKILRKKTQRDIFK